MKSAITRFVPLYFAIAIGASSAVYTYCDYLFPTMWEWLPHGLELKVLDAKFQTRGRQDITPGVVIAAGDEKTIEAWGRWGTWDRKRYGAVLKNLFAAGADVVAFDLVFADEAGLDHVASSRIVEKVAAAKLSERAGMLALQLDEKGPGAVVPAQLAEIAVDALALEQTVQEATASDALLTEQLSENSTRVVQGFIANPKPDQGTPPIEERRKTYEKIEGFAIPEYGYGWRVREGKPGSGEETTVELAAVEGGKASDLRSVVSADGELIIPLDPFLADASYIGFFTADPDYDGVARRLPLVYRFGDAFLPSMSLMAAALHFGATPLLVADPVFRDGLSKIVFAAEGGKVVEVPVDATGALRINYYGPSNPPSEALPERDRGVFHRLSLVDIENDRFDKSLVKGKVVVVAVTAIGTYDQRVTPFSPTAPGTETHVAAIQNMLSGQALDRPWLHVQIEMVLALLLAAFLGLVVPRLNVAAGIGVVVGLMAAWGVVDQLALFRANLWFFQLPLQAQMALTWGSITAWGYLTEGRDKARLKKEFSTVLNPNVVEELLQNPQLAGLGGAERDLTVMFSDIRGFTTMSEKLSPEGLTKFLNEYLTPMTDIVIQTDGTLDKYIGDALMAFWGAPVDRPDHAARAALAAVEMIETLETKLKPKWRSEGKPDIEIGIGLNSGLMRVGFMGSERMRSYTVLGDNVNLGSRLEGTNKNYGTYIIASGSTYDAAKHAVHGRELDAVRVKGKKEPVKIYEILGRGPAPSHTAQWVAKFEEGLTLYKAKKFDAAEATFRTVITMRGGKDAPSDVYLERCDHFRHEPPPADWDGVYEFKTK